MFDFSQLAFIGPGGPEFLVVMLVLIVMFGAKDAPKMFRKINEILNQVRNTADSFKREIMYGDLTSEPTAAESSADDDGYDYYDDEEEHDYSDETAESLKKDLDEVEPEADGDDDVQKA